MSDRVALRVRVVLTIVATLCALGAIAADTDSDASDRPQTAAEYAATPQANGEKPVCRHEVVTGSRISKVVCLTPSQRKQATEEGRRETGASQIDAQHTMSPRVSSP